MMKKETLAPAQPTLAKHKATRAVFFLAGCLCVTLGAVGVVTPVLPTTPFMILAAGCFARSSPRFHLWLIQHKTFGPLIINWQEKRAIPRRAKYLAWTMMSVSCAMLFYRLPRELWWIAVLSVVFCAATALWMARLPDA